ncbi:MAG: hypothetical protein U9N32_09240, partial [Spirochaetota bacterium]|nr:hypothetical protein [Spirochaetota bacterium]
TEFAAKKFKENHPDTKCAQCKKAIPYSRKFCSSSCSASYSNNGRIRTEESKKKMSEIATEMDYSKTFRDADGNRIPTLANSKSSERVMKICKCGKEFETTIDTHEKKHCSSECWREVAGGLRHRAGRGKKGWYKGYFCDSTYELAYVIYNIDNNVEFERSKIVIPYSYKNKKHNYHPDFENSSTLIEVKGYHTEQVDAKIKATKEAGYNLQMLYKDDLKYAFDYVKDNYDYVSIEDLYEKDDGESTEN